MTQFEGNWTLQTLNVGPDLREWPMATKLVGKGSSPITLKVDAAADGQFNIHIKVVNDITGKVTSEATAAMAPFSKFSCSAPAVHLAASAKSA